MSVRCTDSCSGSSASSRSAVCSARAVAPLCALVGEQSRERFQGQLTQPLPLRHQPVFENRLGHAEPRQQVAAIELDRLLEAGGRSSLTARSNAAVSL